MKRIYLITFLTICTCNVLLSSKETQIRKCFSFTWIGPRINEGSCTDENIPCIDPIYNDTRPNTTKMWNEYINNNNESPDQSIINCDLTCIKYTYIYNGLVINASHFCGKVIEDQAIAVTIGCYVTHTEGYTIEACACQSEANKEPCNSAIRNTYSILITFMATVPLFIYKIFNIP